MDSIQFSIFITSIVGLHFWNRYESRNDIRRILMLMDGMQTEIEYLHQILCILEERNKGK